MNMTKNIGVIPEPFIDHLNSIHRMPSVVPITQDSLERAIDVSEGDKIYLRRSSQIMINNPNSSIRGFSHSFYPGHITQKDGELYFVSDVCMPSHPAGYGMGHQQGTELPLKILDQQEFYRQKSKDDV